MFLPESLARLQAAMFLNWNSSPSVNRKTLESSPCTKNWRYLNLKCTIRGILTHKDRSLTSPGQGLDTISGPAPAGFDPVCVACPHTRSINQAKLDSNVSIFHLLGFRYGDQRWFVKALIQSMVDLTLLETPFPSLGRSTPPETGGFSWWNLRSFCRDSFLIAATWLT